MSDLKLVTTVDAENPVLHDLEVRNGQIQWAGLNPYDADDQADMIRQRIACRVLFIKGEWYLDQKDGTPWREVLWAKGTTRGRIERTLRTVIEGTPGVAAVTDIVVQRNFATREATVTFSATLDTGRRIGPETLDLPFYVKET